MQNNNVTYEFPVRPRPLQNESIDGYLLRLGAMNGRFTKIRIADVLGIRLTNSMYEVGSPSYKSLIVNLREGKRFIFSILCKSNSSTIK